jgi:hypothetical protein
MARPAPLLALAFATALGCGSDGPSNSAGFVQISDFSPNPQQANCATNNMMPPSNIGAPDTVLMQVQMVNTTANDVNVTAGGTQGTVMVATDPLDVGAMAGVHPSLPFTPTPAVLVAESGDLTIRVAFPTAPLCQQKPVGYVGQWDVNVSVRMTTTSGQYVTVPKTIRVAWVP